MNSVRFTVLFFSVLVGTAALAQSQQQSPAEAALGNKLLLELQSGVQCSATLIDWQRKAAAVEAELKALKDKYEPKADAAPAK